MSQHVGQTVSRCGSDGDASRRGFGVNLMDDGSACKDTRVLEGVRWVGW